jgi:hypothetical protein
MVPELPATALAASVGSAARTSRHALGWTKTKTAAAVGMSYDAYLRFERHGDVSLVEFIRIAQVLGLSPMLAPFDAALLQVGLERIGPFCVRWRRVVPCNDDQGHGIVFVQDWGTAHSVAVAFIDGFAGLQEPETHICNVDVYNAPQEGLRQPVPADLDWAAARRMAKAAVRAYLQDGGRDYFGWSHGRIRACGNC